MSQTTQTIRQPTFPRGAILGAGLLLVAVIGLAGAARLTDHNHVVMPATYPVATRDLAFRDLPDGGIAVSDAASGAPITTVAPQTGGFLRGIMRGLVRGHRLAALAPGGSFRLTRWADGRLSIEDPATHERFELEAFGSTNEKVFAQFLPAQFLEAQPREAKASEVPGPR